MDVLTILSVVKCIKSKSKNDIIETLKLFDEEMLRHILLVALSKLRPSIKALSDAQFNVKTVEICFAESSKFKNLSREYCITVESC